MDVLGLLGSTKRRLLEELHAEPSTAQAMADKCGIQVSAVRTHLEALEGQGLVRAGFHRAGVGRPRKIYELTHAGEELFPRRYHLLLTRLIERLAEREGRAYAARLLEEVAAEIAAELHVPREGTVEERAYALASALSTMGFEAAIERTEQGLVLSRRNCIFLDAAREHHDLVCSRFDQEMVRAAFGGEAALECCIATGDRSCRNVLLAAPAPAPAAAQAGADGPQVPSPRPPAAAGAPAGNAPGGSPS